MSTEGQGMPVPRGVRWARLAGVATGVFLAGRGLWLASGGEGGGVGWRAYGVLLLVHGVLLALPWRRVPEGAFRWMFAVLVLASVAFAFGQIAEAMFGFYELAAIGKKPGLPAFQGTLVFLAILQVPAVLFCRRPELLR